MTSTPIWFGRDDRPLFGWLHVPDGARARAGVVLCPPLAHEYAASHATFRALAIQLEAAGLAALRLDYAGVGDSGGSLDDPGGVEAASASVGQALVLLRRAGCKQTALVGMRMGATLAATAAALDGRVDALALWDPCASGRSFLRETRGLHMMGSVVVEDLDHPQAVEDLERVTVAGTEGRLAGRCLVLTRPDRPVDRRMTERLSMGHVEWAPAEGQPELLDVGTLDSKVPQAGMARIAAWLGPIASPVATPMVVPPTGEATVGRDQEGGDVIERAWQGTPLGLFGLTSQGPGATGPTLVFLNTATEHHVGPSRLWVPLCRRLAGLGFRTLRVDLSGLGDSPARPGLARNLAYVPEAGDDVIDIAGAVSPQDPRDVVLVGHCSGAYAAIQAGIRLSPRGVCVVNPPLIFKPAEIESEGVDQRVRAAARAPGWVLAARRWTLVSTLVRRLPLATRAVLDRRYIRSPVRPLQELMETDSDVLLVGGDEDARMLQQLAGEALDRLAQSDRFRFEVVPGLDHSLLAERGRDAFSDVLVRHVATRFGAGRVPGWSDDRDRPERDEMAASDRHRVDRARPSPSAPTHHRGPDPRRDGDY